MFASADAVLLNKADLLPYIDFDRASFEQGIAAVNPGVPVIALSCRTGEGLGEWISWLTDHLYR
jgi:hydrogenase nickel incorporation protein HypB